MLGLWGATALVTAGMVGAGILVLPAIMSVFGTWSIFGWILASLMTYSIAIIFGRLTQTFKGGYGPVYYIGETFGPNAGFLAAWGYFSAMCASGACIAMALGKYMLPLIGIESLDPKLIGIAAILLLYLINIVSSGSANLVLLVLTIVKVLFFVLIGLVGFKNIGSYSPSFGGVVDVFKSASVAMFAFLGIEFASVASASVENPEKNIMRATKLGLLFASLTFIGTHCAVLFTLADPSQTPRPVYDATQILFGNVGAWLFGVVAVLSCISTLNGIIMVEASTVKTIADNSWMHKSLGFTTKQGFAWKGGLMFCAGCFLILLFPTLNKYALYMANSLVGVLYLLTCFVDVKKKGWDAYNICAILSALIILYNINLVILLCMAIIYTIGYTIKCLNRGC